MAFPPFPPYNKHNHRDSSRDACRSEYSDDVREASGKYANVGFRVVRVDL